MLVYDIKLQIVINSLIFNLLIIISFTEFHENTFIIISKIDF